VEIMDRPFTRADLAAMPDDGRRYEIIDGVLIVSAAPGRMHQRAVGPPLSHPRRRLPAGAGGADRFRRAGTPAFWVVDPAEVRGDEVFPASRPFPVRVYPSALVR
jgi:hypothetical protein